MNNVEFKEGLIFQLDVTIGYQVVLAQWESLDDYNQDLSQIHHDRINLFFSNCDSFKFKVIPITEVRPIPRGFSVAYLLYLNCVVGVVEISHDLLTQDYVKFNVLEGTAPEVLASKCTCDIAVTGCVCEHGKSELQAERKRLGIFTYYR